MDYLQQIIEATKTRLKAVPAGARQASWQYADRHIRDAEMLMQRGAFEPAMEKAQQAREATDRAEALAAWL